LKNGNNDKHIEKRKIAIENIKNNHNEKITTKVVNDVIDYKDFVISSLMDIGCDDQNFINYILNYQDESNLIIKKEYISNDMIKQFLIDKNEKELNKDYVKSFIKKYLDENDIFIYKTNSVLYKIYKDNNLYVLTLIESMEVIYEFKSVNVNDIIKHACN
jgi:DNA-binding GntR family transcriptional regulator